MSNRVLIALILAIAGLGAAELQAQVYYNGPGRGGWWGGGGYGPATAAESYANGMSDLVRARGQYELDRSQSNINNQQAYSQYLANRYDATKTYFEMRKLNREYRAAEAGPRPTEDQLIRYAQAGAPKPLSESMVDTYSGKIYWPAPLTIAKYERSRNTIDEIFAERALNNNKLSFTAQQNLRQTVSQMKAMLKEDVANLDANDYTSSKRFLESLSYGGST